MDVFASALIGQDNVNAEYTIQHVAYLHLENTTRHISHRDNRENALENLGETGKIISAN